MKAPFRGFTAILFKEFTVIFRDYTTLFFMFFPPIMQIIAFGYALDTDVKNISTVVLDEDRTTESRLLVEHFVNTRNFRVVSNVQSLDELSAEMRRGRAYMGIHIPPDFTRQLRGGRTARVQVLIDGSNSTTAMQALNTAVAVALRESLTELTGKSGTMSLPVEVRPQVLYNPAMRSPNFFVPGVIGVALQIATVLATALSIVRERERGTLEQLLVSPLSRWGLMLAKIVPYLCISMTMAVGLFIVLRWLFDIPIAGSLASLLLATFLYVFTLLSLGLLISTFAQNHMQAIQMAMIFLLPTIFFSGFIFPRETMPWIFYAISTTLPSTYYIELLRAIILRGATLNEFWFHIAILGGMGAVLFVLCAMRYRKRLA